MRPPEGSRDIPERCGGWKEWSDVFVHYGERGIGVTVFDVLVGGILTGKTIEQVETMAERSAAVADGLRPLAARVAGPASDYARAE